MDTAWMIRNDAKPVPITHHIYADPEDEEDILCAAAWLYQNTAGDKIKYMIIRLFVLWARLNGGYRKNVFEYLTEYAIENKGFFPSKDFFSLIKTQLECLDRRMLQYPTEEDIREYLDIVLLQLNQEFLRARYGGMYDTEKGNQDMIFRISSVGFDWYPIIAAFVRYSNVKIETVTIVRDAESTGMNNARYKMADGNGFYEKIPLSLFLKEYDSSEGTHHLYFMKGAVKPNERQIYGGLYEGQDIVNIIKTFGYKSFKKKVDWLARKENELVSDGENLFT